jgi:hypothetical protein
MLTILDTNRWGSKKIYEYGVERAMDEFKVVLAIHNKRMADLAGRFVGDTTEDKRFQFGGNADTVQMVPVERQYGRSAPQTIDFNPYDLGIRLDHYEANVLWDELFLARETVDSLDRQMNAILTADRKFVAKMIKVALFDGTNYLYEDRYGRKEILPIKGLLNADSLPIPVNPQTGDSFTASTHTHYQVIAAINATTAKAVHDNLTEHMDSGRIILETAYADAASWTGITGFKSALDMRVAHSSLSDLINYGPGLDLTNPYDRFLGISTTGRVST